MLGGGPVDASLSSSSAPRRPLLNLRQEVYAVDWNRATGTEFVAASGLGDLRIFDIRKGDCQDSGSFTLAFRGLDDSEATGCAWSRDGRRLAGTWLGGRPYTFDVEAGVTQRSFEGSLAAVLNACPGTVFAVTPAQRLLRIVSSFGLVMFLFVGHFKTRLVRSMRELENFDLALGRQRFISRSHGLHVLWLS
jgi:WD40 repeat protein